MRPEVALPNCRQRVSIPLTLLPSRSYSNVFSAQILSLKPEVHSTNEDKLCVKVLKKTAFAPFFIALIKFKKNELVQPGRRECQICQSNFIRQYKCRYASTAEGALKANGSSASSWKVTYSQASCFARTACSSLLFSA